ncbi:DUF6168 family protein [Salibacteraceae bacterium]|nr:DUF6168 family protein [Salibacteraceae bacterium]MDB4104417.1 DUF6168 family protein [Salibacteraceae bacterium]MDB9708674.1 DUF6168 family protein [Salibacteraceae bacterium]MDC1220182.1 DUF6168 family protein [bacterium]
MIPATKYSAGLLVLLLIAYAGHWQVLGIFGHPVEFTQLLPFYSMNYVLGVCIVSTLIALSKSKSEILGFVFMGGSLVKFAVFFIFFYPELHGNDELKKATFNLFFVPYVITVIAEVWYLIRFLNRRP